MSEEEELVKYLENFDEEKELKKLASEEVLEWIKEEWNEFFGEYNVSRGEATSMILDSNLKWMNQSVDNELFVYQSLLDLNKTVFDDENDSIIQQLKNEINKISKKAEK